MGELEQILGQLETLERYPRKQDFEGHEMLEPEEYVAILEAYRKQKQKKPFKMIEKFLPYIPLTDKKGHYYMYTPPAERFAHPCFLHVLMNVEGSQAEGGKKGKTRPEGSFKEPTEGEIMDSKVSKDVIKELKKEGMNYIGTDVAICRKCNNGLFIPSSSFAEGKIEGSHSTIDIMDNCVDYEQKWNYPATMKLIDAPPDKTRFVSVYTYWSNLGKYYPLMNKEGRLDLFLQSYPWDSESEYYSDKAKYLPDEFLHEALSGQNRDEPLGVDLWKKQYGDSSIKMIREAKKSLTGKSFTEKKKETEEKPRRGGRVDSSKDKKKGKAPEPPRKGKVGHKDEKKSEFAELLKKVK